MATSRVYEAQKRYIDKNLKTGMARVNLWVPAEYAEEVKTIAKSMRSGAYKKNVKPA